MFWRSFVSIKFSIPKYFVKKCFSIIFQINLRTGRDLVVYHRLRNAELAQRDPT